VVVPVPVPVSVARPVWAAAPRPAAVMGMMTGAVPVGAPRARAGARPGARPGSRSAVAPLALGLAVVAPAAAAPAGVPPPALSLNHHRGATGDGGGDALRHDDAVFDALGVHCAGVRSGCRVCALGLVGAVGVHPGRVHPAWMVQVPGGVGHWVGWLLLLPRHVLVHLAWVISWVPWVHGTGSLHGAGRTAQVGV